MNIFKNFKIGDKVQGLQGIDGDKKGTIFQFGKDYAGRDNVAFMKDDDNKIWDTLFSNLKKI